jgi:hypothetical protein
LWVIKRVHFRNPQSELILNEIFFFGVDDAYNDVFEDEKVEMQQYNIILVDFFHMVGHPLAYLVQPLSLIDDSSFKVSAVVVLFFEFRDRLVGKNLII